MRIKTGQGTISLITLIGIWSISALTSLPGLAISPILGDLSTIFPNSTELDIQMLTSLPSLLIIPFIILSGKLTEKINNIYLLQIGLVLFLLSGILYFFCTQMWQLIVVSGLLGIGAGIIIPLSTGLISRFFTGEYRLKQFGLSSSISNITLVLATSLTGYLAEVNWHLPFLVYLIPLVSIFLSFYLKRDISTASDDRISETIDVDSVAIKTKWGIDVKHLLQIMGFYGLITFLALIVTFNLPFIMKEYNLSSGDSGIMISLFFLALMVPGLFLNKIVNTFKEKTKFYSLLLMVLGMAIILIIRNEIMIGLGCILIGLGYGVMQPAIYEQTTYTSIPKKTTLALALVMSANYLAILLSPFINDFVTFIFHTKSQQFPFLFNMIVTLILAVWAYIKKDTFLFSSNKKELIGSNKEESVTEAKK